MKEFEGRVLVWWTNAERDACDEIAEFPDGADLEAAVDEAMAHIRYWSDEDSLAEYEAGTFSAEIDGKRVWQQN